MKSVVTNRIVNGRKYEVINDPHWEYDEDYEKDTHRFIVRRIIPKCGMVAYHTMSKQLVKQRVFDHIQFSIREWLLTAEKSQKDEPKKWEGIEL